MTILRGLRELRSGLEGTLPLTSSALLDWLGGWRTEAGVDVSETSALSMSAVYRSVNLISSLGGALPVEVVKTGTKERVGSELLEDPNPDMTAYDLWKLSLAHRLLWGNSYAQKIRHRGSGQVAELWPVTPSRVQVERVRAADRPLGSVKVFWVTDDWGEVHRLTSFEILHVPGLGYDGVTGCSPVRLASQGIGLGLAAERYGARLFGSGNLMSGILQTEQRLQPEDARRLKERWAAKVSGLDRAHEIAVLDNGAKFQQVQMPNSDAQFIESRQFQTVEIARFFGVPLFLLMSTEKTTSWGTGLEQQAIGFVTFDLHPTWLAPQEQWITKDLLGRGLRARYDVDGLLRGDSKARAEFYRVMREVGAYSANDIRDKEDETPIAGGDTYLRPLNMVPLGAQPDPVPDEEPPGGPDNDDQDEDKD